VGEALSAKPQSPPPQARSPKGEAATPRRPVRMPDYSACLGRELVGHGSCPTAVAQRMHFYPNPVLPFVQLQRARTAWHPKVPMMAAGSPRQFTLASNDDAAGGTHQGLAWR
jgi:hypothetical protein